MTKHFFLLFHQHNKFYFKYNNIENQNKNKQMQL